MFFIYFQYSRYSTFYTHWFFYLIIKNYLQRFLLTKGRSSDAGYSSPRNVSWLELSNSSCLSSTTCSFFKTLLVTFSLLCICVCDLSLNAGCLRCLGYKKVNLKILSSVVSFVYLLSPFSFHQVFQILRVNF